MKRARIAMVGAAVLAVATVAFAQAKPDFSGTWTPEPAAAPAPPAGGGGGRMGGGMAGPMTVKQTADTLTIERTMGENKMTSTYKLDGTESTNAMGRGGEAKSTAKWDGNKLTITTKQVGQDGTERVSTQTWSLDAGSLTIESTRTGRDGNPTTAKMVYKKTT